MSRWVPATPTGMGGRWFAFVVPIWSAMSASGHQLTVVTGGFLAARLIDAFYQQPLGGD